MSAETTTKPYPELAPYDDAYGFSRESFDPSALPNYDCDYLDSEDLIAFETALQAPDPLQSPIDDTSSLRSPRSVSSVNLTKRDSTTGSVLEDDAAAVAASAGAAGGDLLVPPTPTLGTFVTAQNDWAPVTPSKHRNRRGSKKKKKGKGAVEGLLGTRTKDETREGYLYLLSKWPLLFFVFSWLIGLSIAYISTRWYIWFYEQFWTWRGRREILRKNMRRTSSYKGWVTAAKELDDFLGRKNWREVDDFAYYDSKTVKRVWSQIRKTRAKAEALEIDGDQQELKKAVDDLRALLEACVKNNFVGVENPRLYSQTYYGTKNLVQNFVDDGKRPICALMKLDSNRMLTCA